MKLFAKKTVETNQILERCKTLYKFRRSHTADRLYAANITGEIDGILMVVRLLGDKDDFDLVFKAAVIGK